MERRKEVAAVRWLVAILASITLVLSACSKSTPQAVPTPPSETVPTPSPARQTAVVVQLKQWAITPTSATVPAGTITFSVTNVGTIPHEFVVLATDTPAADLP